MAWNQRRYDSGYEAAKALHEQGLGVTGQDLANEASVLPQVDEYEVGWRDYTDEVLRKESLMHVSNCVDEFGPHDEHTDCLSMLAQMVNDQTALKVLEDGSVVVREAGL